VLATVTCAPITRTIRGIRSEVELGPGAHRPPGRGEAGGLDRTLRYALDIQF
jgi:mRNA-degrading endonuclease toxin of MazEF toxin-antitoxin module